VRRLQHVLHSLLDRQIGGQEVNLGTGHHDVTEPRRASVEDVIDDLAFLRTERGCSTDQGADLLVTDLLTADIGIASKQLDSNVGDTPRSQITGRASLAMKSTKGPT
jgi:hypothetical protein